MSDNHIKTKLDNLANLRQEQERLLQEKQAAIPQEIMAQLAEIDAKYSEGIQAVSSAIAALESEVKQDVVEYGASVKATFLHAVFNKGRVSWDTKRLDGYAVAHPEILDLRKEGDPSVSLRAVK